MLRVHIAVVSFLLALGTLRVADAACTPSCTAPPGPCTLTAELVCDSPASVNLDGRALVVPNGKPIRATGGDGSGSLLIAGAASVTLQTGAVVRGEAASKGSGQVTVISEGPVLLASGSTISVSADPDGGFIEVIARSGDLQSLGALNADGARNGEAGEVALTTLDGTVTVGGRIDVSALGDDSGGGSITIDAGGDARIQGELDMRGGDAGDVFVDADGSITTELAGDLEVSARAAGGFGGSVTLLAAQDVNVKRQINATAPGNDDFGGGVGGELLIGADAGDVSIAGPLDFSGSGPDGEGGIIEINAGRDLTVSADMLAGIQGGGIGGSVTLSAPGRTSIAQAATVDVHANDAGGSVMMQTDTLTIQGKVLADSGATGVGGRTQLVACTLDVVFKGEVSSTGTGVFRAASNLLQASGAMTISGTLSAGDRNRLEYRDTPPTIGSTAMIDPEQEIVPNPALPCCGDSCPISTTTTTIPASTTTVASTSTTSSSTAPGVSTTTPTTSTTLPSTVTTTVAPASSSTTTTAGTLQSTSTSAPPTVSSTTPTTTLAPTTTSTLPPPTCLEQATDDLDDADCYLSDLSDMLGSQPPAALGGAKTAGQLSARVNQAKQQVATARSKAKPGPTLLRAKQQLLRFRTLTQKRRKKIAGELWSQLRATAKDASAAIDRAREAARTPAQR